MARKAAANNALKKTPIAAAPKGRRKSAPTRKVLVNVWLPLLNSLREYSEEACLRQDAFLSRVLDYVARELANTAIRNSDEGREYLVKQLRKLETKAAPLSIAESTLEKVDVLCARMNVHRDCLINRVLLLLVPGQQRLVYDWLYETKDIHAEMFQAWNDAYGASDYDSLMFSAMHAVRTKLEDEPFGLIRPALREFYDEEDGIVDRDPLTRLKMGKFVINGESFDITGLNVNMPDAMVPGTPDHEEMESFLKTLL